MRAVASTGGSAVHLHPLASRRHHPCHPATNPCSGGSPSHSPLPPPLPPPFLPLLLLLARRPPLASLPTTSPTPLSLQPRVSCPSRPGPRATTESTTASRGMLRVAVNVTLKTECACTHPRAAPPGVARIRTYAGAQGAVSYVQARWTLIN